MEGNSVDRQLGLTLPSTGDLCYNSKPFISPKFHQKNILRPRYKMDTASSSRNFSNYLQNYKIPTPNIVFQIFQATKIRQLTNKPSIPEPECETCSKIGIYLHVRPSDIVGVCLAKSSTDSG
jgi:hypothetical protein